MIESLIIGRPLKIFSLTFFYLFDSMNRIYERLFIHKLSFTTYTTENIIHIYSLNGFFLYKVTTTILIFSFFFYLFYVFICTLCHNFILTKLFMAIRLVICISFLTFISVCYSRHHHLREYKTRQVWNKIKDRFSEKFHIDNRHFYQYEMILFPDIGFQTSLDNNTWKLTVHGWRYNKKKRKLLLEIGAALWLNKLTKKLFGESDKYNISNKINLDRLQPFFLTDQSEKFILIKIGDSENLVLTGHDGRFYETIEMKDENVQKLKIQQQNNSVIPYTATFNDQNTLTGVIQLIEPNQGISVISDIDDTIKISEVFDKIRLIANTFIFPFKSVPGKSSLILYFSNVFHWLFSKVCLSCIKNGKQKTKIYFFIIYQVCLISYTY